MNFKISLTYGRMQNINDRDVKFNQTLQKKIQYHTIFVAEISNS